MNAHHCKLLAARLYGILDTGYLPQVQFAEMAHKLILGGAGILQIRAKNESLQLKCSLVEKVLPICTKMDIPLVINDDLEIAIKYHQLGLHLGQDDLPVEVAREELGSERIIGLSSHSKKQVGDAFEKWKKGTINYFAIGPVFSTLTKPDYIPVSLDLVKWTVLQGFDAPHFFIGGINRNSVLLVKETGAKQIVVVSDLLKADDPTRAAKELISVMLGNI